MKPNETRIINEKLQKAASCLLHLFASHILKDIYFSEKNPAYCFLVLVKKKNNILIFYNVVGEK